MYTITYINSKKCQGVRRSTEQCTECTSVHTAKQPYGPRSVLSLTECTVLGLYPLLP